MKRVLSIVLVVVMMLGLCPTITFAASSKFEIDSSDGETCVLMGYTGNDTHLTIPTVINGKRVVMIATGAFYECDNLQSVKIPEGVDTLDFGAFSDCKNLSKVSLPSTLTSLNGGSFLNCPKLEGWNVGCYFDNWLGCMDPADFQNGTYKIKDGTVGIMCGVFGYCSDLINIEFADSVRAISSSAFSDCYSLTSVKLPHNLKCIGEMAFYNCKSMKSIYIPKSTTFIGAFAFELCDSLTDVYYEGTKEEWDAIDIQWSYTHVDDQKNPLYLAKKHYNSYTPQSNSPVVKPSKISNVKATVKSNRITLRWKGSQQADGYIIEQYKSGKWTRIAKTTKLSYTVKQLKAGTKYKFRIKAYNKVDNKTYYSKYVTFSVTTKKKK